MGSSAFELRRKAALAQIIAEERQRERDDLAALREQLARVTAENTELRRLLRLDLLQEALPYVVANCNRYADPTIRKSCLVADAIRAALAKHLEAAERPIYLQQTDWGS